MDATRVGCMRVQPLAYLGSGPLDSQVHSILICTAHWLKNAWLFSI